MPFMYFIQSKGNQFKWYGPAINSSHSQNLCFNNIGQLVQDEIKKYSTFVSQSNNSK
jgi:hypothetical protein